MSNFESLSSNNEARYLFAQLQEAVELAQMESTTLDAPTIADVLSHLQAHLLHRADPAQDMLDAALKNKAAFFDAWVALEQDKRQIPLFDG